MLQINNLTEKFLRYRDAIDVAINRVISSGWVILGPEVINFENKFASFIGVNYCVGVANGTDAIELGLLAIGIGKGDLVGTVANAGMYTTTAILAIGAKPYFMDVDLTSKEASLKDVQAAINAGVKAIVITHLYGLATPEIESIAKFCSEKKVYLLEDCAQAHGAKVNGRRAGSFGDLAAFSFYPTKNLGALGDGGAVVTNSVIVSNNLKQLRQYGWSEKYKIEKKGGRNSRLDELQAAILTSLLKSLDSDNLKRRVIATKYGDSIINLCINKPVIDISDESNVVHLYVILTQNRDSLREHLRINNVASEIHYPIPDYRQPVLQNLYSKINLVNTEILSSQILTLPCHPEMNSDDIELVINSINSWSGL